MKNIFGNTREIRKRMTLEERSREKQKCLQNMDVDSALNEDYTAYSNAVLNIVKEKEFEKLFKSSQKNIMAQPVNFFRYSFNYTQYYTLVGKLFFQKSKHYFIAEEI